MHSITRPLNNWGILASNRYLLERPMAPTASTAAASFPHISGYSITEQLYEGPRTAVYRAVSVEQQPVVIKILRQEYPTFNDLVHFQNQYEVTKTLPIANIIRPLSLERWRHSYALVMEDFGGISLQQYAQAHALPVVETLSIAVQLSTVLHELCQHQVVHKDIKPANILIHPISKRVKLIDFSIASLLPKSIQERQNPHALEGTLAYLAPEQTGRMNRGIDYRTDFYGFGVTLYELLTGELPFLSTDPLELVHCHIAKTPTPPDQINPAIPAMVSQIVVKLLAKNAEDRYQSALGLKHDLEKCLVQWKETGSIAMFELGQKDVSDRFLIPEKLYGRDSEVQALLAAFERTSRGRSEMMLVAGFSGIGKTAVVNEVHKPITRQQGYFIKGKFDQFNRDLPLSAIVQALQGLIGQILTESDVKLAQWRNHILNAVGKNGQILIEVLPELERVIGPQPVVSELSGNAAQHRFNLLFQKFIAVFTTSAHPLVMFLDDLQWADSASLQLLNQLMEDTSHLLLLGAYRDNEVSPAHPLILTVEELAKAGATVNTITLDALSFSDTNLLVADTLHCSTESSVPLTELMERKTQGNPFFITQFLKALYEDGNLFFNDSLCSWECDIAQIASLSLTNDVVEFMAQQLQKLTSETQNTLKLAACIGNQFELQTLAIATEQSQAETAATLWQALEKGLIIPTSEVYKFYSTSDFESPNRSEASRRDPVKGCHNAYRFLHDRVQQAAYSLVTEEKKPAVHLRIGQLLQQQLDVERDNNQLFSVVNHLNKGLHLITDSLERHELLQLNAAAGYRASTSSAYKAAFSYFQTARQLLPEHSWQQHYELTKQIYTDTINNAYLSGDFDQMETLFEEAREQTHTLLDRVPLYEIKIQSLAAQHRLPETVQLGLETLHNLGVHLPEQPTPEDFGRGIEEINSLLAERPVAKLINLPEMEDPMALASLTILLRLSAVCMIAAPHLMPFVIFKMVTLSIQQGNAAFSALAYATYGMLLCSAVNDIETGYAFGQLALQVSEKLPSKVVHAKTLTRFYAGVDHFKSSLSQALKPLANIYQIALENGDLEYAAISAQVYSYTAYFSGQSLVQIGPKITAYSQGIAQVRQTSFLFCTQIYRQHVLNLLGHSEHPSQLVGEAYNETTDFPQQVEAKDAHGMAIFHLFKAIGCYLFEAYEEALEQMKNSHANQIGPIHRAIAPFETGCAVYYYDSLVRLANLEGLTEENREGALEQVDKNQQKLKLWADHSPINYQHKFLLVEAERNRVLGHQLEALEHYDLAIASARSHGYQQDEAMAYELAAKFYLAWGKQTSAAGYMQEAYYGYSRWGAQAKTNDLENRYPSLLQPILQKASSHQSLLESQTTLVHSQLSIHASTHASTKASRSTTSINDTLDLTAVLRASQGLSSSIHLDELLRQLTTLILQNSGGDLCAILLPDPQGKWQIKASATAENFTLCSVPLDNNPKLPSALIQYVKNTQEVVIIEDLETELPVIDDYLKDEQPRSILCLPLFNQGNVIGILYLSNQSASGVFTENRLITLNLLCTQAAISLENARLYQQAQAYAEQLEQSQLQTVQSEKMAALGNLVAGVAHEINNPIGFLNGSIRNAQNYVQDLQSQLDLYQQHYPDAVEPVQENAEDIDLDFVCEDLPKLLNSMKGATDRIKAISTSLRTFSRADTEHKVSAHLHEGIDSTLLILKYRLKANETRPAIEVIKDYQELPAVECFPGRLNQVFMNLLANAIDVFDEAAEQASFAELKDKPQTIMVRTALLPEQNAIEIRISDNGKGMPEAIRTRIFDHLFTTKGVGKGTGLGLAIARQIITEAHGGSLDVQSTPGQGTEFCIRRPL